MAEEWRKLLERCIRARHQEMFDADAIRRGSRDTTIEQHVREQHAREQHAREQYAQEQHVREQHVRYIWKPGPRSEKPTKAEEMLDAIRTIVLGSAETGTTEPRCHSGPWRNFAPPVSRDGKNSTRSCPRILPHVFPWDTTKSRFIRLSAAAVSAETLNVLKERLAQAQTRRIKLTGWGPFIEIDWQSPNGNHAKIMAILKLGYIHLLKIS